jgi:hypothetical protein
MYSFPGKIGVIQQYCRSVEDQNSPHLSLPRLFKVQKILKESEVSLQYKVWEYPLNIENSCWEEDRYAVSEWCVWTEVNGDIRKVTTELILGINKS